MIEAIAVFFIVVWALGLATGYTAGGLIHVLLLLGIIAVLFRLFRGRKTESADTLRKSA